MKTEAPGAGKERATGQDLGWHTWEVVLLEPRSHCARFTVLNRTEDGRCTGACVVIEEVKARVSVRLVSAGRDGICRVDLVG